MRFLLCALLLVAAQAAAQTPLPVQQYGKAGKPGYGPGTFLPSFHTGGEFPILGNGSFHLHAQNLSGGTAGFLLLASARGQLALGELIILVDPLYTVGLGVTASGSGMTQGSGEVKLPLPVPQDPALCLAPIYTQGVFVAVLSPQVELMWSHGLELHFHASFSPARRVIHDRLAYNRFVTGTIQGQAVWQANAVPGFTYVGTNRYSCGGQSHWIVTVKDNRYGIEFMLIPGGSFRMGDIGGGWSPQELPVHWVRVRPFLLARTEISQDQWYGAVKTRPWQGRPNVGPKTSCAANHLTWNQVNQGTASFCGITGFRLPSEAEWEYACRAGTETDYHFGAYSVTTMVDYAWYGRNMYQRYARQVGTKKPNAFGLHDMYGNVQEYCRDFFSADYKGSPIDGSPNEKRYDGTRVQRGGAYYSHETSCRSASRARTHPDTTSHGIFGFRPALSLR